MTQKGLTLIHSDNVTDTCAHTRHFSINVDYFLASHLFRQPTSEQRDEALGTERSSPWAALSAQQSQRAGRDGLLASGTQRRGRHEARSALSTLREPWGAAGLGSLGASGDKNTVQDACRDCWQSVCVFVCVCMCVCIILVKVLNKKKKRILDKCSNEICAPADSRAAVRGRKHRRGLGVCLNQQSRWWCLPLWCWISLDHQQMCLWCSSHSLREVHCRRWTLEKFVVAGSTDAAQLPLKESHPLD